MNQACHTLLLRLQTHPAWNFAITSNKPLHQACPALQPATALAGCIVLQQDPRSTLNGISKLTVTLVHVYRPWRSHGTYAAA